MSPEFREKVALALLSNIDAWMPKIPDLDDASSLIGEEVPKDLPGQMKFAQKIFTTVLKQNVDAVVEALR